MKKKILGVLLGVVATASAVRADLNNYNVPADQLQNSTHTRFLNSDGLGYNANNNGNTFVNYWWNAHAMDMNVDAYQRTRNGTYATRAKNVMHSIRNHNNNVYPNAYYDDMAWLALASLRMYHLTGDAEYLSTANTLWASIKGGFTSGMFSWSTSCHPNCKNAISNDPAIILGARLYQIGQAPAADLTMIQTAYTNVKSRLIDPASGAVWDNIDLATGNVTKWTFSYNQGMFIGAALELYKVTGDVNYINDAKRTADWSLSANNPGGLLFGGETGGGDGGLFKGIFIRYLALFAREAPITDADRVRYNNAIKTSANLVHSKGLQRPEMLGGANWAVPPGTVTDLSSHLSSVYLLEAASIINYPHVYRDVNYLGGYSSLPPGSYTTAQLSARGVFDNDITSITVPQGWTVTLYENDAFGGASFVRTANDGWLGAAGWNDRVSSLVVTGPASNAVATVYQDCNYAGYSVSLPAGNHDVNALWAAGIVNDDISSVQMNGGYTMTLYLDSPFTGSSSVQTVSNSCLVGAGFNDNVSSLRIASSATATRTSTATATRTATATATRTPTATATTGGTATFTATATRTATPTAPASGCAIGATCEAETAALGGGVVASTLHAGYTGSGFADYQGNGTGYVEWTVSVPAAGTYSLNFRYANGGTADRPMSISVNGTTVSSSLSFPVTGWTTWTVRTLSASLPAGSVKIRATELPNGPNVDNLVVTGGATPTRTATATATTGATATRTATATATRTATATPTTGGGQCAGVAAFQSCTAYASGAKVVFNNTLYHAVAPIPATRDCPPNSPFDPSTDNWWVNDGGC
jgi:predicted alpha-1,6-mannanase (GH76 family)